MNAQAFDIPLPKTGKTPPPVAERLANTPRNASPSSLEIKDKLNNAAAKRDLFLLEKGHRSEVEKVKNEFEARKRKESEALREASKAKQQNASIKRENERLSWVQKLAAATNQKIAKGKASLEESQRKATELEASLEQKIANAEVKREQLQMKTVEDLKSTTDEKLQRGRKLLASVEADSRRLESEIQQKLTTATFRKENLLANITRDVEKMTDDKMVRGKIAISSQEKLAKKNLQHSLEKVEAANERREGLLRDHVESLRTASTKKEQQVVDKQLQADDASRAQQKNLAAKLCSAELARDELLKAKANKAAADDLSRLLKAKAVAVKEVQQQRELGEVIQDKLLSAEARKEKLLKESVKKISSSKTNNRSPRVSHAKTLTLAEIERKIDSAAERRDNFLAARVCSSSSKRVHSPRGQSDILTVADIEQKIESASERRKIYLKEKISKAKASKSSPDCVSKNLSFSSVSPNSSPSPRIKAARLEASTDVKSVEAPQFFTPMVLAIAIISAITLVRFSSAK